MSYSRSYGILGFCIGLLGLTALAIGIGWPHLSPLAYVEPMSEVKLQAAIAMEATGSNDPTLNRALRAADIRVSLEDYRRLHGELG